MAEPRQSSAFVFDDFYGDLIKVGLPLPLVVSLKSKGLTLESAMWTVKSSATGFSLSLFWPTEGVNGNDRRQKKKRTRKHRKSVRTEQKLEVNPLSASRPASSNVTPKPACSDTFFPVPAQMTSRLALPPDTPTVSASDCDYNHDMIPNDEDDSDNESAVLDKVVQVGQHLSDNAEFVIEDSIGPALKFTTKSGMCYTPIRIPGLEDDVGLSEEDKVEDTAHHVASVQRYLQSCKSVEYVRVDGKPGLTLHRGRCQFWTSLAVTPEVIRTKPKT